MRHWHRTTAVDDQIADVLAWLATAGVAILLGLIAAHGVVMIAAAAWRLARG